MSVQPISEQLFEQFCQGVRIEQQGSRIDIREDRGGPEQGHNLGRGHEGEGRREDEVARADPRGAGDRAMVESNARPDQALAWMRAEDLFFLQIQGSGYLTFEDGSRARAAYAADNGRPFVGIARPMARQGLLPENGTSGDAIRAWLAEHRGYEAQTVMALNPRYIFFRLDPDDDGHPAGAAGVPLTERRAVAVDPLDVAVERSCMTSARAVSSAGGPARR